MSYDKYKELWAVGGDRNILVYDNEAKPRHLTKKLIEFMRETSELAGNCRLLKIICDSNIEVFDDIDIDFEVVEYDFTKDFLSGPYILPTGDKALIIGICDNSILLGSC